jgi:cytochrome c biogenesis protein CcdA
MTPRQMAGLTVGLAVLAAVLAIGAAFIKYKVTGHIDWIAIVGGVLVVVFALGAAARVGKSGG